MSIFNFFNIFKRKEEPSLFSGGNGGSFETAVVVNADHSVAGVQAEYAFVTSQCGQRQTDWTMELQTLQEHNGKPHDILNIRLSDGQLRIFHFDVSKFFGKRSCGLSVCSKVGALRAKGPSSYQPGATPQDS
jgi:hypothetical protein